MNGNMHMVYKYFTHLQKTSIWEHGGIMVENHANWLSGLKADLTFMCGSPYKTFAYPS